MTLALLALLFGCELDAALRAAAKSSLPPRVVKNITAKIQYADTMRQIGCAMSRLMKSSKRRKS